MAVLVACRIMLICSHALLLCSKNLDKEGPAGQASGQL
jgi:hypothetical protein